VIDPPRINDLVIVKIDDSGAELRSRIEDATPGNLSIAYLSDGLTQHRLPHGTRVTLEWLLTGGVGNVDAIVVGQREDVISMLDLQLVSEPMLVQRRRHVRADMVLDIMVCVDEESDDWVGGVTLDVSGGGVRVLVPAELPLGSRPRIAIDLPDGGSIEAAAIVVAHRDEGIACLAFDEIVPSDREQVIRAVFRSFQLAATLRQEKPAS
jgi:c-di-GMP-binding flagellar brake protein YcgR